MRWNKQLTIDIGEDPIPIKTVEWLNSEEERINAMEEGPEKTEANAKYQIELNEFMEPRGSFRSNTKRKMTDVEKAQYEENRKWIGIFGKQNADRILRERMKSNEKFERIKKKVLAIREDLIEWLIVKNVYEDDSEEDEDDKIMIDQGRDDIKTAFNLKESITDLTDVDYLKKIFNEKLKVKLGYTDKRYFPIYHTDTIVVKLLVFPSLTNLKRKYAKELGKIRIKSAEEGGSEKELDNIRREKGLYIYDEFRTSDRGVYGLKKSRLNVEKKYDDFDDYDSIYQMFLRGKGGPDWIFTIVENGEDSGEAKEGCYVQ